MWSMRMLPGKRFLCISIFDAPCYAHTYSNDHFAILVCFGGGYQHYSAIHNNNDTNKTIQYVRCGPCLLMAPEFEEAAKDLSGKVRFVKLDTDLEPDMAARLGIMGLPTLLFLDKNDDTEAVNEGKAPVAVLKERIEGALRKESIKDLCDYHFFDGPMPTQLS